MSLAAWLLLGLVTAQPASVAAPVAAAHSSVSYHGVLIRVPDLDRALDFYSRVIGFQAERLAPTIARLADSTPVYLEQVSGTLRPPADDEARSSLAFQTHDIRAAMAALRDRGVTFLADQPNPVGVGLAVRFRDPFGNIHALLQQTVAESPPFDEPEVYNSGYKHPDADTAALRALFVDTLGFVVRSERYYPPSIPIGHRSGSFAFMLHENEPWEAEVRPRSDPETAAVSLIFAAPDLAATRGLLARAVAADRIGEERDFPLGRRLRVTVPSGVPAEFWRLDGRR